MYRLIAAGVAVLLAILTALFDGKPEAWRKQITDGMQPVSGEYRNAKFGYNLALPANTSAWVENVAGRNGVLIVLGYHRTIYVAASSGDCCQTAHDYLQYRINDEEPNESHIAPATLAGRPAEQATMTFGNAQEHIVSMQDDTKQPATLYNLSLVTDGYHDKDEATFGELVKAFSTVTGR